MNERLKASVRRLIHALQEILRYPNRLSRYLKDLVAFRSSGGTASGLWPVLGDFEDQAGIARGHYFHQDLLVATYVFENTPRRHIDVGSRVDGFVAHVAAFREIEIVDVRPFVNTAHSQIGFLQQDMMSSAIESGPVADSISCLHAIEHFGLGRYGEPIDPEGHLRGFSNLVKMLEPGGHLYISFPIGAQSEVLFNAHRVFSPLEILDWPGCETHLSLKRFDFVDDQGDLHTNVDLLGNLPILHYGCGIYTFVKD